MPGSTRLPLVLLASAAPLVAEPVFTDPVGMVKLGNTTGGATPAVAPNTDLLLTIPLDRQLEFSGTISSVSGSEISMEGAPGWSTDQWEPSGGDTFSATIGSLPNTNGPESGVRCIILSNTADALTVSQVSPGDLASVPTGATLRVRKAWTLKSFFEESTIPPGTRINLYSGTTPGINLSENIRAVWSGSAWIYLLGGTGNADGLLLHPGESFVLRTGATGIAELAVSGDVPLEDHRISIDKLQAGVGQDTHFGYFSPVPEAIGDSSVGVQPGDRILSFDPGAAGLNKSNSKIIVYNGSNWVGLLGASGDVSNTFFFEPGVGYIYRQASAAPVADSEWADTQSYNVQNP